MSIEEIPPWLVPGPNILLEMQMLATIISGFTYGLVLILSLSCFRLIYQKLRQDSEQTSKRIHRFLLLYTAFMASLGTLSLIGEIISVRKGIFTTPRKMSSLNTNIVLDFTIFRPPLGTAVLTLPLAIWSADGFMVRLSQFLGLMKFNNAFG